MGRSHDALRFENEAVRDIVTSVGQEVIDIISQKKPTETISSTHDKKYALNGNTQLAVYLACTGANIAATDTLTFKFYVRQQINGIDKFLEIAQTSNYTVTTAGVTADKVSKIDLDDADDIIKNATHYSVATSAGIAMPANCHGVLFIGKHFASGGGSGSGSGSGGSGGTVDMGAYEIDSVPAPVSVSDSEESISLTKAEILNSGSKTIYICEDGNTPDTDSYPLYPGERMGLLTGDYKAVCDTGETSTLRIVEFK